MTTALQPTKRGTGIHPIDAHIGQRIRDARIMRELSQQQLADALGITFQQLQKYETGKNRISGNKLYFLCERLRIFPNWLFEGLRNETPSADFKAMIKLNKIREAVDDFVEQIEGILGFGS